MLKVKYPRITNEWTSLKKKNPSLAQVVWDLQVFVKDSFKKDVIITHLFRTQKQQELFYGKGTKRKSPTNIGVLSIFATRSTLPMKLLI
jgi:hypothetical protein